MRRIALAVAAMALLAACGHAANDNNTQAPASPQPNQADVTFVQGMIPHHQGAIQMATSELSAGSLAEVKQLAQQIITA